MAVAALVIIVGSEEVAGDKVSSRDEFGVALSKWWGFDTITQGGASGRQLG